LALLRSALFFVLSGSAEPTRRLGAIFAHCLPMLVHDANVDHGLGVAEIGRLPKKTESFNVISRHAFSFVI
jgi:hypothetical protein